MSIFRMAERLSGRWRVSQGYCGERGFDEPQVHGLGEQHRGTGWWCGQSAANPSLGFWPAISLFNREKTGNFAKLSRFRPTVIV